MTAPTCGTTGTSRGAATRTSPDAVARLPGPTTCLWSPRLEPGGVLRDAELERPGPPHLDGLAYEASESSTVDGEEFIGQGTCSPTCRR